MNRQTKEYVIFDSVTPKAVTSSTDATPIVITATSHGFSNGDLVLIYGHTTNVAANGIYKVANKADDTFELTDRYTSANIAGSGAGAGAAGLVCAAPKIILASDFRNCILQFDSSGSFNGTIKIAGSSGLLSSDATVHGDTPNFGATQSKLNPYTFLQIINLDTAAAVNGATGITSSGSDLHNQYEVNINGMKYLTLVPTAWTAGTFTVKAILFNNL